MRIERFLPRSIYATSFDRGRDRLVVAFSPAGTPAGKFPRMTQHGPGHYDVAAFNAPDAQWYVNGIPETADDPRRFETGLSAFVRRGGYRRVLFYGASKGAFAAVDFGLRCGATSIMVTGLESLYGLCPMFRRVVPAKVAERQRERLLEWPALAQASRARIHSFYGVETVADLLYAWVAPRRLSAEALIVGRAGHYLPPLIEGRTGLADVLADVLERDRLAGFEKSLIAVDLDRIGHAAVAYVQAVERRRIRPGFSPAIVPQNETERYVVAAALVANLRPRRALALLDHSHGQVIRAAAWQTLRARALLDAGDWAAAEPIARHLHEQDPPALEPVQILHRALIAGGRHDEAAKLALTRYRWDRERVGLLESYLRHLAMRGKKAEATEILHGELAEAAAEERLAALYDVAARVALPLPQPPTRRLDPAAG